MSAGHTPSRTQTLLAATAEDLQRAASVRFVTEIESGELDPQVFANYLSIEQDFVTTASRLHGMAVWSAPDGAAIARHTEALRHLTVDQAAYFDRIRSDWPVPAALSVRGVALAAGLSGTALRIARTGGYAGVVTSMLAAEQLYATWCARAAGSRQLADGPVADWVRMHTEAGFRSGVADLTAAVDGLVGPDAPDHHQLVDWFTTMLAAEVDFHAAPYELA